MSVLIISRTESRLIEQVKSLETQYKTVKVKYLAYDFTKLGKEKVDFYGKQLPKVLSEMHQDGGIGVLVNNVGTANEHPKVIDHKMFMKGIYKGIGRVFR